MHTQVARGLTPGVSVCDEVINSCVIEYNGEPAFATSLGPVLPFIPVAALLGRMAIVTVRQRQRSSYVCRIFPQNDVPNVEWQTEPHPTLFDLGGNVPCLGLAAKHLDHTSALEIVMMRDFGARLTKCWQVVVDKRLRAEQEIFCTQFSGTTQPLEQPTDAQRRIAALHRERAQLPCFMDLRGHPELHKPAYCLN